MAMIKHECDDMKKITDKQFGGSLFVEEAPNSFPRWRYYPGDSSFTVDVTYCPWCGCNLDEWWIEENEREEEVDEVKAEGFPGFREPVITEDGIQWVGGYVGGRTEVRSWGAYEDPMSNRHDIVRQVQSELEARDRQWGQQSHVEVEWATIIGEEFGEMVKHAVKANFANHEGADRIKHIALMRFELIQLAAVTIAAIESIDRQASNRS